MTEKNTAEHDSIRAVNAIASTNCEDKIKNSTFCHSGICKFQYIFLRGLKVALAWFWAGLLVITGLWVITHQSDTLVKLLTGSNPKNAIAAAGFFLGGGQFVFLMLVADDLCPHTPSNLAIFFKTFSGSVTWISLAWLLWALLLHVN